MNLKQLGLLFGLVGVSVFGYAADGKNTDKNCKTTCRDRVREECKSLCFAGPMLETAWDLELSAAAIYEQVSAQGAEIGLRTASNTDTFFLSGAMGQTPVETMAWGFKIGLAWKTNHDDWKLAARYTNLRTLTQDTDLDTAYGGGYFPTMYASATITSLNGDVPLSFQNLRTGNNTQLNTLNIYLLRPTLYTSHLEVSPYFGIDLAITRRRQVITFNNENPTPVVYTNGGYYRVYDNNSFWGVGPMGGVATKWHIGYDMSVYADGYFALTYGQSNSHSQNFAYALTAPTVFTPTDSSMSSALFMFSPEVNGQLGLAWTHLFEDECGALSFKIGYEAAYYFHVNRTIINGPAYLIPTGNGIGAQGLVLEGKFDF